MMCLISDKNCSLINSTECPKYSKCSNETLKCVCLQNYKFNPTWQNDAVNTAKEFIYCTKVANNTLSETIETTTEKNKVLIYVLTAPNTHHLGFAILMVLLFAILSTAFCYLLKVARPIKRTKKLYRNIKYKRQNVRPLQEFDEIDLERRNNLNE